MAADPRPSLVNRRAERNPGLAFGERMVTGSSRRMGRRVIVVAMLAAALGVPAAAIGAFPGTPHESPRANTPNDPDFDRCEADDPDTPAGDCSSYFSEEFRAFGFSPDSANLVPTGALPHAVTGTRYDDCSQLDAQGREANVRAEGAEGNPVLEPAAECLQLSGVRLDSA